MADNGPLYLGFDLSTQQLKGTQRHSHINSGNILTYTKAIVIQSDLSVVSSARVDFDQDFGAKYKIINGVIKETEGQVFAPVALWLESLDLVLKRLQDQNTPLNRIRGISGSCQQHGSVYWGREAEKLLGALNADKTLVEQLTDAFSHPYAPNWQDHSTQNECDKFEETMGTAERLAQVTGSSAHHVSNNPFLSSALRCHR